MPAIIAGDIELDELHYISQQKGDNNASALICEVLHQGFSDAPRRVGDKHRLVV